MEFGESTLAACVFNAFRKATAFLREAGCAYEPRTTFFAQSVAWLYFFLSMQSASNELSNYLVVLSITVARVEEASNLPEERQAKYRPHAPPSFAHVPVAALMCKAALGPPFLAADAFTSVFWSIPRLSAVRRAWLRGIRLVI